jgi:predicted HD phosphohydrolase
VERATFDAMAQSTAGDWAIINKHYEKHCASLADRVLQHLKEGLGDFGGFPVDRLEHSLQTATRAFRAGVDEELVACAVLHDLGDTLAPYNHAELAAAVLKPFVSEQNHWLLAHHGVFQGYYFFHHQGLDRDLREQYRGHPHFAYTARFCHLYDQCAFEAGYDTMPLEAFEPMVRRLLAAPKHSIHLKQSA